MSNSDSCYWLKNGVRNESGKDAAVLLINLWKSDLDNETLTDGHNLNHGLTLVKRHKKIFSFKALKTVFKNFTKVNSKTPTILSLLKKVTGLGPQLN